MARSDSFAQTTARLQGTVVRAITGYYRLQDFIHAIRGCKTQAEERALVMRESAAIRTAFKTADAGADQLYHAVAKLLFIHMMGYPASFGQVESLKMVASPRIAEKRLGYLGSTQLIDGQQPTLTLITNSIKNDLQSQNPAVVSIALSNLALTTNAEIALDLADEIDRLLREDSSPHVRRKAAFCAGRMVRAAPELAEVFADHVSVLLSERNHAVVLGGLALLRDVCAADSTYASRVRVRLLPIVVRHLQAALSGSAGFAGEYDVGGVCDPFLQVRLLQTLRLLLADDDGRGAEAVSDVLAHVASNTDAGRNVGHAVLYETVVTIMNIPGLDSSLRTMATNILGRLLSSPASDHNLRYVSLALLAKIQAAGAEGASAVARHRDTVLACLGDADMAIVRRATDLAAVLLAPDTAEEIVGELLGVLTVLRRTAPDHDDFRRTLVGRLANAATRYGSVSRREWYVSTMVAVLRCADGCGADATLLFTAVLRNTGDAGLCSLAARRSWAAARGSSSTALMAAAAWCVGEYAELVGASGDGVDLCEFVATLCRWCISERYAADPSAVETAIGALAKVAQRAPERSSDVASALRAIAARHATRHALSTYASEMLVLVSDPTLASTVLARLEPDPMGDRLGQLASAGGMRLASASQSAVPDVFAELATLALDDDTLRQLGKLVYERDGMRLHARLLPAGDIVLTLCNGGRDGLAAVSLQVAVPRSMRLTLDSASGTEAPPGDVITQRMHVALQDGAPITDASTVRLRVKLTYRWLSMSSAETAVVDVSGLAI